MLNFAALDWCAERLLAGFVDDDLVATTLVTGENFSWKLDKLSTISTELLAEKTVFEDLCKWVQAATMAKDRRNQIMHSFYAPGKEEASMVRMKATTRGKWRAHTEPMDLGTLQEVVDLLAEGVDAALNLAQKLATCPEWHGPADLRGDRS